MEDDELCTMMTTDKLISAMLHTQRQMAEQVATLQCNQAQQQQQFGQMLQTLTSAIQNQPAPTIALPTTLVNPAPGATPTLTHPKIPLPDAYDGTCMGAESFLSRL